MFRDKKRQEGKKSGGKLTVVSNFYIVQTASCRPVAFNANPYILKHNSSCQNSCLFSYQSVPAFSCTLTSPDPYISITCHSSILSRLSQSPDYHTHLCLSLQSLYTYLSHHLIVICQYTCCSFTQSPSCLHIPAHLLPACQWLHLLYMHNIFQFLPLVWKRQYSY